MALHYRRAITTGLAALFLCAATPTGALAFEIQGQVLVAEPFPEIKKITVTQKPHEDFPDRLTSPTLIISPEGHLKNAVISLEGDFEFGPEGTAQGSGPWVLDQKDYRFNPHVLVLPAGATLKILNPDPMDHDVRAFSKDARMLFRYGMRTGETVEYTWKEPGAYVVRCGMHKWMHAWVFSAEHPYYAVSDGTGKFQLSGVPPGSYNLKIWHETLGKVKVPVEVQGSITDFSYTFQP